MRDVTSSAHHPSEDVSAEVISSDATSEGVTSADAPSPENEEQRNVALSEPGQDKSDAKLLFPLVYTTTVTAFSIQSVTSTIPFTCFNGEWHCTRLQKNLSLPPSEVLLGWHRPADRRLVAPLGWPADAWLRHWTGRQTPGCATGRDLPW